MSIEKCYVCIHVFQAVRPVLYVLCDHDGDLVFACGADDHQQSADDWKVAHRGHVLDLDGELAAVADLDVGQKAERATVDQPWVVGTLD